MAEDAGSITALAGRLDRDVAAVHRDLDVLFEHSLIEYDEEGGRKQPRLKHDHVFVEPLLRDGRRHVRVSTRRARGSGVLPRHPVRVRPTSTTRRSSASPSGTTTLRPARRSRSSGSTRPTASPTDRLYRRDEPKGEIDLDFWEAIELLEENRRTYASSYQLRTTAGRIVTGNVSRTSRIVSTVVTPHGLSGGETQFVYAAHTEWRTLIDDGRLRRVGSRDLRRVGR